MGATLWSLTAIHQGSCQPGRVEKNGGSDEAEASVGGSPASPRRDLDLSDSYRRVRALADHQRQLEPQPEPQPGPEAELSLSPIPAVERSSF